VKLEEAGAAIAEQTQHLRDVPAQGRAALEAAARQAASSVRQIAARNHHDVQVRVVNKPNGVRVTIAGRHAARYRTMVEQDLAARLPGVSAQIRTMTGGKSR
jgi:hypothetical protein